MANVQAAQIPKTRFQNTESCSGACSFGHRFVAFGCDLPDDGIFEAEDRFWYEKGW